MRAIFNNLSTGSGWTRRFMPVLCLSLAVAVGCSRDDMPGKEQTQGEVIFQAAVGGPEGLTTRVNNAVYDVTAEFYGNCDFYMTVAGQKESGENSTASSIYEIPSGSSAVIVPRKASGANTLTWFSRTKKHEFWGWAAHRDLFAGSAEELQSGDVRIAFKGSTLDETTGGKADTWKSAPDQYATTLWKNGEMLEPLVGAKTGPLVYDNDGMYVPLKFRHLVSKILLKDFYIIDNATGTTDKDIKGHITFYGMPDEAVLHTNPKNDSGEPVAPYVEMSENWEYDPLKSVTYAITNSTRTYKWEGYSDSGSSEIAKDCWYVCPEIDFGRITFKIDLYEYSSGRWIPSTVHGKHGSFYGDFTNVTFERNPGTGYDENKGGDEKILHAGEYLVLTVNLSVKGNPGVKVELRPWQSASRNGSSHVYPGLYSLDEVKYMTSLMASGSDEDKQTFYDLYGSGRDTGTDDKDKYPRYKDINGNEVDLKILELYDDIGGFSYTTVYAASRTDKAENLRVADGYILDGQGHTVNFYCMNNSSISIGNVRNIYLRAFHYDNTTYSERIVYIDNMGQVWKVDTVTFEMTKTVYNLNDFTKNPVSINLNTGAIK